MIIPFYYCEALIKKEALLLIKFAVMPPYWGSKGSPLHTIRYWLCQYRSVLL